MFEKRFSLAQVVLIVLFLLGIAAITLGSVAYARYGSLSTDAILSAAGVRKALERPSLSHISISCFENTPSVALDWTRVEGAMEYTLSRQSPGSNGWPQIVKQADSAYIDTSFATSGIFSYQVKATGPDRRGSYSNIRSVRVGNPCSGNSIPVTIPTATSTPITKSTTTPAVSTTAPVATTTKPTVQTPPVIQKPATPPSQTFTQKEWGAFVGWQETALASFESLVGAQADYQAVFVHWGNEKDFPMYLKGLKDQGKTLVIFWEALDYTTTTLNQPKYNYDAINAGNWDSYITKFATDAATYGGPVIIIPFSEMNGNWFATGGTVNGNTPAKFITAWKRTRGFFTSPNVKFGWAPNSDSHPDTAENQLEKYYPGNQYVDYVGVDGFNDGKPTWRTFDQIFGDVIKRLSVYNKPLFIFSFASMEGTKKAAWITDALTVQMQKYPQIKGWIWFNENKEKDWRVNSDPASLSAFKAAVQ